MGARAGIVRRLQLWLIDRLRSSQIWPVGLSDKRTDVARLGEAVSARVLLFFPSGADSLYQLRPWLPALEALHGVQPLVCVFRDSRTANAVRSESNLDCLTLARYGQLDEILSRSEVKLALYVNHDPINFECLRFTSMLHVYLGHGDSDKGVSISNQVKAYDYCFLAGQAALDRTSAHVMAYDAPARSVLIGQPQLDAVAATSQPDPQRPTVLYAPTWEASQPSVSYGSVLSHGERVITSLRDRYRVIYRPHPLNGVTDGAYGAADQRLRGIADRVDTQAPIEQSFADADLLITDVSAVILSWLPSGKPVLVARPAVPVPPSALMDVLPLVDADDDLATFVERHLADDPTRTQRQQLIEHYLGDTTPGVATLRFIEACSDLIEKRDQWWPAQQERGAAGP